MSANYIVLGIISAIVAGNAEAVDDMLRVLAKLDARKASDIFDAMGRGLAARQEHGGSR